MPDAVSPPPADAARNLNLIVTLTDPLTGHTETREVPPHDYVVITTGECTLPERIQLRRTKGWRKPEGVVVVTRPGRFGNPYSVKPVDRHGFYPYGWVVRGEPSVVGHGQVYRSESDATTRVIELFRREVARPSWADRLAELRGKDLACWCPLDQPCHADVLLRVANEVIVDG